MVLKRVSPPGALGANYNESLVWVNHDELRRMGAKWVRGFVDMHRLHNGSPDQDPNVKALLGASRAGFNVILSLKWNYSQLEFPARDSPGRAAELARLRHLLPFVLGKVDILIIGNEPFIESRKTGGDEHLNDFYETIADAVIDCHRSRGAEAAPTRLFMGALNRLDLPVWRTPAAERMLAFIASRPELEGIDLHLHIPFIEGHRAALDWALPRIRPDQTFLATEFSLIWHWKNHMGDVASSHYREKYGLPPDTTVLDVIGRAIADPMPYAQWEEFLSHEPWYMARRHFLANAMRIYRSTGRLEVATYGFCPMRMRKQPLRATEPPWLLNGLLAPPTVRRDPDGSVHDNFPWADEFRRLQV